MSHSADQPDSSDDLIAELARLMAEGAQGEREPARSAGTDFGSQPQARQQPSFSAPSPQPTVRIPGQSAPATTVQAKPASFSKAEPVSSAPASSASSLSGWQRLTTPDAGRLTETQPPARSSTPAAPAVAAPRHEVRPSVSPARAEAPLRPSGGSLFGDEQRRKTPEPRAEEQTYDPIAAMIAEHDSALAKPEARPSSFTPVSDWKAVEWPSPAVARPAQVSARLDRPVEARPSVDGRAAPTLSAARPAAVAPLPVHEDPVDDTDSFSEMPAPAVESPARTSKPDPLDEIENLIGEAVRRGVSVEDGTVRSQSRRPEPEDVDDAAVAAEAAIRAIAEASMSGRRPPAAPPQERAAYVAPFDDVEPDTMPAEQDGFEPVQTRPNFSRYAVPVLAAAVVLVALGGGAYWFLGMGGNSGEAAPFLASNTADAKVRVELAQPAPGAGEQSIVFNQLQGNTAAAASEQIVPREQTAAAGDVARVISTNPPPSVSEVGLANRKVRTVTVRPDGSIVAGDDALAATEVLPVDRPDVPRLPSDVAGVDADFRAASPLLDPSAASSQSLVAAATRAPSTTLAGGAVEPIAQPVLQGEVALDAPIPAPRINRVARASTVSTSPLASPAQAAQALDLLGASGAQRPAPAAQPAPVQVAAVPSAPLVVNNNAAAYVQLSSQRTEEAAQQTLNSLRGRFQAQLSGASLEVQRVDLADRGTFFRVRVPVDTFASANSICENIKRAGGDCFVRTD